MQRGPPQPQMPNRRGATAVFPSATTLTDRYSLCRSGRGGLGALRQLKIPEDIHSVVYRKETTVRVLGHLPFAKFSLLARYTLKQRSDADKRKLPKNRFTGDMEGGGQNSEDVKRVNESSALVSAREHGVRGWRPIGQGSGARAPRGLSGRRRYLCSPGSAQAPRS